MPINYYCGINLNQTSLLKPVIDPQATPPDVGTEVAGQMYFDNAGAGAGIMYFWSGTAWRSMDATAASGVTSFTTTKAGNSTGNPLTVLSAATGPVTVNSFAYAGAGNIGHVPAGGTGTTFLRGDGTFATPAGGGTMSSFDVGADTGTTVTIADGNTINFINDTNGGIETKVEAGFNVKFQMDVADLSTNASPATGDFIPISPAAGGGTTKATIANILALAPQGDITAVTASTAVDQLGIKIANPTGPTPVVGFDIIGQTNLAATPAVNDELMIYDLSTTTNKSITVANLLAAAPQGDITAIVAGSGMTGTSLSGPIPTLNVIGGSGLIANANDMAVDYLGTDSVIKAAPTLSRVGATGDLILVADPTSGNVFETSLSNLPFSNNAGVVTSLSAGTFVTITGTAAVPIVNAEGTTAATASKLIARDSSGFGFALTPNSGDSTTKLATTAFVQQALTGLLQFISGFNANTGIIADGSGDDLYTDRAIAIGDYYVVTAPGNFFGSAATPLTPGDSVICQTAAAAGSAVEADFIVVQSDTDVATLSAIGLGNVNAGTGIGVTYSNGTATVTNSDLGSSQLIFRNVAGDSGTAVADNNNDTLTIAGGANVTTTVVGDTLTISATNATPIPARLVGVGLTLVGNTIDANVDGVQSVAPNSSSSTAARTYKIQVDSTDELVVNVPWDEGADTGVTSVLDTEGTASTGTPLVASISGRVLTIDSRKYNGAANIGYVPQGGTSSTFLRGDGTWVNPAGGVSSVAASTATNLRGLSPTTPGTGAVVVGLNIANMVTGTVDNTTQFPGVNTTTNLRFGADSINTYLRGKNSYAATITGFGTVTHSLGTYDVIVQLYNATTYENVEACVDRTSVNALAIAGSSFPAGNIRVLVSRVG